MEVEAEVGGQRLAARGSGKRQAGPPPSASDGTSQHSVSGQGELPVSYFKLLCPSVYLVPAAPGKD